MIETLETRRGVYDGHPYKLRVTLHGADRPFHQYDRRQVEARTTEPLASSKKSSGITVQVRDDECVEAYEHSILGWTYERHEPRSYDEHVTDVIQEFEEQLDEKLRIIERAQR